MITGLGVLFQSGSIVGIGASALILTVLLRVLMWVVTGLIHGSGKVIPIVRAIVGILVLLLATMLLGIVLAGIGHAWTDPGQYWEDIQSFFDHF